MDHCSIVGDVIPPESDCERIEQIANRYGACFVTHRDANGSARC